jgi:phosphoglycerate kinase
MNALRSIESIDHLFGMRVIVRTSMDVPIADGVVQNEFRIEKSLPTITYLLEKGARVIILTHVGRDAKNTVAPLVPVLQKHIPITYIPHVIGEEALGAITHMKEGSALLLENVRSYKEEEENNQDFAQTLASYADFYVNDAFAVSHRAHASIVGIPKYLPSFAGRTFVEEYTELCKALEPQQPSLFILGGAKYETKAPLIAAFSHAYTTTFIGGALANDFLKGSGFEVGVSLVSPVDLHDSPLLAQPNILIPIDVCAVSATGKRIVASSGVHAEERILDVGPRTLEILKPYIMEAKTILWNGPLGNYEEGYDVATKECAKLIAGSNAFSIVGGGDTVAAIESLGLSDRFGFLSTAGGAMLEFLEKKTLPGIEVLQK